MNKLILNTGVQDFIIKYLDADIMSVLLKKPYFEGISNLELAQQIEAKKKCQKKLTTWFNTLLIYYPTKLNIEQCSSEITAAYKAKIISGNCMADLTGGFGVDTYFFSQKIDCVMHCEIDQNLSQIVAHNFQILGVPNVRIIHGNGLSLLQSEGQQYDWVYLDPSRRDDLKGKVYRLADCSPNVIPHLDAVFLKSKNILLKSSPLLDLSAGIGALPFVKEIHIVAVNNNVKELLWVMERGFNGQIAIKTINIKKTGVESFNSTIQEEKEAIPRFSTPLDYLYEPNGAIMKSGAFSTVGNRFSLFKLHPHTHLYSSKKYQEFPGRVFKIEAMVPNNKKAIRALGLGKANITARNFGESVAAIRKKHHIQDGGEKYVFFTKIHNEKTVALLCTKVKETT